MSDEDRVEVRRVTTPMELRERMAADVREGLAGNPKTLPPKYFYDARGSRLFQEITRLPEYYLTRTERRILERTADELAADLAPRAVVEFGSGSAGKTRLLLEAVEAAGSLEGYAPVDVSPEPVRDVSRDVAAEYPDARVRGIVADFETPVELPFGDRPRLVLLLGSTIGNFTAGEARAFLSRVAYQLGAGDAFLLGFDLVKEPEVLERAYNDRAGITAAFNKNVLRVLNRELRADFDEEAFRHRAFWNGERRRIEMHLVAERAQRVEVAGLGMEVELREGESIRTELSHKYTRSSVEGMFAGTGLELERWETDPDGDFALGAARPG